MTDNWQNIRASLQSFPLKVRRWIAPGFIPQPRQNVWQWAESNVDFSLATNYDTPIKGKYDPDFMPFWKEPVECLTRNDVNEVVVLKCARAGGSENLLLNAIRFSVAVKPQPTLYVTGDQLSAERMMEKRIKRSFRCSKATATAYRSSTATQHDIAFQTMDFRVTWPKAKQAFKQDGWALILCDEVSTWPEFSTDMARKRTASYPFPHIVFISSPDPQAKRSSEDDPIFVEYLRGDQRKWTCRDANGCDFVFNMGGESCQDGLKWSRDARKDDGTWDYDKVRASAYYVTPSGCRIDEKQRMHIVRGGRWVATKETSANARSYHVNAFVTPFESFGSIAVAFLKAKTAGSMALRTFIYEWLAEPYYEKIDQPSVEAIAAREIEVARGSAPALPAETPSMVIIGADVQKAHVWWAARKFWNDGESVLLDYGAAATFEELDAVARKYDASRVMIDAQYRKAEVYEASHKFTFVPVEGHDRLSMPYLFSQIDPFEGTRGQGDNSIPLLKLDVDVFRTILLDCIRGESARKWSIPRGLPLEYQRQIMSMRKVDGQWVQKGQDHLFDCETYALAGAVWSGAYRLL